MVLTTSLLRPALVGPPVPAGAVVNCQRGPGGKTQSRGAVLPAPCLCVDVGSKQEWMRTVGAEQEPYLLRQPGGCLRAGADRIPRQ